MPNWFKCKSRHSICRTVSDDGVPTASFSVPRPGAPPSSPAPLAPRYAAAGLDRSARPRDPHWCRRRGSVRVAHDSSSDLIGHCLTNLILTFTVQTDGSLADPAQWPAVWAGAIASGFGKYAFTTDWTGGAPHPFWTAGAHPTGGDWTAWATGTWAGAGQFYEDPQNYFGKQV